MARKTRLQITLDPESAAFLEELAWARHMSKSGLINAWLEDLRRREKAKVVRLRKG